MAWCPLTIDDAGLSVVAGFCDGVIRVLRISSEDHSTYKLSLINVSKPHSDVVIALSFNGDGSLLASGVSV